VQFTKLRLQGFKSFVDPAELVISTGLTGVVGLLEALRWVMGENRPTAMRGEGMEDVIFAGAESRPARNSASVEMIIDNSERLAPAQFNNDDALEVSRRITRDIGPSTAKTCVPAMCRCCSPMPRPARIRQRWSARARSAS
jgi:chromosome segregation protein